MGNRLSDPAKPESSEDDSILDARRDFLKKASAAALYTPPSLILLMQPSRTAIASGGVIKDKDKDKDKSKDKDKY